MTIACGKTRLPKTDKSGDMLEITSVEQGYILSQLGILIANSVVQGTDKSKMPLYLVNNTNRTITLKKGCVVGRADAITKSEIASVRTDEKEVSALDLGELIVNPG